ncbi:hypothetical protein HYX14_04730 [Candidatus Woesearchaeota archaeon]|nr:hypothetical protein [Candidatus Woesearchaeota archaeon]
MKLFAYVNPGLEQLAVQEIKEVIDVNAVASEQAVEFDASPEEALKLLFKGHSFIRICALVSKSMEPALNTIFPWNDFFVPNTTFKLELKGIQGEEERQRISKLYFAPLFSELKNFSPKVDFKKPQITLFLLYNNQHYYLGVDLAGFDLNSRYYRVFTSQASMKGDLAYYFLRKAEIKPKQNILFCWVKDGTMAIEAATYLNDLPVQSPRQQYSFSHFPLFQSLSLPTLPEKNNIIHSVAESLPTFNAFRKNASIAGVQNLVKIHRYALDELELKFEKEEFDTVFFYITKKDENKINELYYQTNSILKKKGKVIFITRKGLDLPVPSNSTLLLREDVQRGDSTYCLWMMQKEILSS